MPNLKKTKNMQDVAERQTDLIYQQLMTPGSDVRTEFTGISDYFQYMADAGDFRDDPQMGEKIRKIAAGFGVLKNAQSREDVHSGLQQISGLKEFLHLNDIDGNSGYHTIKPKHEGDIPGFYRSLTFLENTLQVDLEVSGTLDRNYQPAWQVTDTAEASPWEAYARQQLAKEPETEKEKLDCMAKAMVGKFMHALPVLKAKPGTAPGPEERFSTSKAATYAKQLKNNPSFKRYFKDPENYEKHMKDPSHLVSTCVNITHPFQNVDSSKQREILANLATLNQTLATGGELAGTAGGKEWKEYLNSLASIDLGDPDSYGQQLQNVFDKASGYMKGRKSLRSGSLAQSKFDFAMSSIAELSKAGEYAQNAAQTLMDRTNEVRIGHDKNYQPKTLDDYLIQTTEPTIDEARSEKTRKAVTEARLEEDYENTFI